MANKRQSKSIIAGSTRVLRPRTATTGHVTKRKAVEKKGAAGSPPKKVKAINKKQPNKKVLPLGRRLTRSLTKALVAVQVTATRKNPVRKCRFQNAKTQITT